MGKKSKKGVTRAGSQHNRKGAGGSSKNLGGSARKLSSGSTRNISSTTNEVPVIVEENGVPSPVKENGAKEVVSKAAVSVLPAGLEASLSLLTVAQQELAKKLCAPPLNQSHLFEAWSGLAADEKATEKKALMEQLERVDASYPNGGLAAYIANARDLLDKSKRGVNPLEGWNPSVPTGEAFSIGTSEYDAVESVGLKSVGTCGFVLVAGGLGERLGYNGIKIGLPTELATETLYVQYYIETILAIQSKYAPKGLKLPLCIMTSGDTNAGTVKLLQDNDYFGMDKAQVTIVQQGDGVPALTDNDASIALDPNNAFQMSTKPHGHGDIHALLYSHQVAKTWLQNGIQWAVFFQDTNGLCFHTLPLALGVSSKLGLIMNSMAVPRKAKQAVGGITKLEHVDTKEEKTINVEYNQLDPLLRSAGYPDGDVNDPATGLSPYPGNINQLIFKLEPYVQVLERTEGAMPEFVNPKYKDATKTVFKKPTRLECMMQDFPTVLKGDEAKKAGFTSIGAELCFSPVKNATADGVKMQQSGTHPGVAATGEADQYAAVRKIMQSIGCQVTDAAEEVYSGISVVPGPAIVLKPSFVSCPAEYKTKFPSPSNIKISAKSSLVIKGSGVVIESLDLDGALIIECEEGATGIIKDFVVKNKGWVRVTDESSTSSEVIKMRGYRLEKVETSKVLFKKDGTIEGDYPPPKAKAPSANGTKAKAPPTTTATKKSPSFEAPAEKEAKEKDTTCCCTVM